MSQKSHQQNNLFGITGLFALFPYQQIEKSD